MKTHLIEEIMEATKQQIVAMCGDDKPTFKTEGNKGVAMWGDIEVPFSCSGWLVGGENAEVIVSGVSGLYADAVITAYTEAKSAAAA